MLVQFCVETIADGSYTLLMDDLDVVGDVKRHIERLTGLPQSRQHLVLRDRVLADCESLAAAGIVDGATVYLVAVSRSGCGGPRTAVDPLQDVDSATRVSVVFVNAGASLDSINRLGCPRLPFAKRDSVATSDDCEPLDLTFTKERELDARRRARENLRTMEKMRTLRVEMEKLRLQKLQRKPHLIFLNSQESPKAPVANDAAVRPNSFFSPEDTSAKESSAGETEHEECDRKTDAEEATQIDLCAQCSKVEEKDAAAPPLPSSDQDLMYATADEFEHSADLYWTFSDKEEGFESPLVRRAKSKSESLEDAASDPSDFSSGMVICQVYRRYKGRKRSHATRATSRRSGAMVPALVGRLSGDLAPEEVTKRPVVPRAVYADCRSYARQVCKGRQRCCTSPIESSTCDSSSDERDLFTSERITQAIGSVLERKSGNASRKSACVDGGHGGAVGGTSSGNPLRNRKQPQSSQSQQRCLVCGYKLSLSVGFQCRRCGKTLCYRHRGPKVHQCFDYRLPVDSRLISMDEADASSDSDRLSDPIS